jgi:hypothetical protein
MFIKLLLLTIYTWSYYCPQSVYTNKKASKAHDYLRMVEKDLQFSNCEVEIALCEKSESEVSPDSTPVAEIYIVDDKGREAYLPMTFEGSWFRNRLKVVVNDTTLHYRIRDRNYEPELGRTEFYRFEMRKVWGSFYDVEAVELGLYATNTQLNQSNGNDSHWFVCN